MDNLKTYYAERAREYEAIYDKPERQNDLKLLKLLLSNMFIEKHVLEIACGTGYWTQVIAHVAASITATDINKEVLEVAKEKHYNIPIDFRILDIYDLPTDKLNIETVFAGFLWSHIPLELLANWLIKLRNFVGDNARFIFIDNNYIEGSNIPINQVDEYGNTYQERFLQDESRYLVLKNFPSEDEFHRLALSIGAELKVTQLQYYWVLEMWWN